MAVNLSPVGGAAAQFFDNSGNVLTGGKLYTYDAGTTTPAPTYTTSSGLTAHPNPIVLNAAGRVPDSGEIWLVDSVSYKFVIKDQNDVLIGTYDNLIGINSNFVNFTGEEEQQTATQGQTVFTLTTIQYQPATNNLLVFVNGSKQVSGVNYNETSSTVITFVDGLNVGDVVDFCTATPINTAVVTASSVAFTGFKDQNGNIQDLADNDGSDWVGFLPDGDDATARSAQDKMRDSVSIKDFGAVGDGVADDTNALLNARDYIAAQTNPPALIFPAGTYKYSSSPNWAIANAAILNQGEVIFVYTGTSNAVIIDAGVGANVTGMTFGTDGGFIVKAPGTALNGAFIRNIYKSKISIRVWGAGTSSAGILISGCVLTEFDNCTVTNTELAGGWYLGAKPTTGFSVTESATGAQTAYCTFLNCSVQSTEIGFNIDSTLGNVFIGGDSEYNTTYGMQLTATALNNKFYGTNFEVNTVQDVVCFGKYNEFTVDTGSGGSSGGFRFQTGSVGNRLVGGVHDQVAIDGGTGNYIGEVVYGRGLSGNLQIIDNGVKSSFGRNWQAQQERWTFGPSYTAAVSVGASPFSYTNTTGMDIQLGIVGGNVSSIGVYDQAGGALTTLASPALIRLATGNIVVVSYTVAPTMTIGNI